MKRHHLLDIYGVELHLATTRRDWAGLRRSFDFLDRDTPKESFGHTTYATRRGGERHLIFWIDATRVGGDLVDTCAHEASHGAGRILECVGHRVPGTDEPHAYLVGWLTRWLWEAASA
ncbi:hypothetical protein [Nocardioides sp. LHG3406-4]|uniref:hypothetical protein n=1 Tax=Nocardioides sp. LHG3406-4 TaxID=2804575 RepID=UPI003CEE0507